MNFTRLHARRWSFPRRLALMALAADANNENRKG